MKNQDSLVLFQRTLFYALIELFVESVRNVSGVFIA